MKRTGHLVEPKKRLDTEIHIMNTHGHLDNPDAIEAINNLEIAYTEAKMCFDRLERLKK